MDFFLTRCCHALLSKKGFGMTSNKSSNDNRENKGNRDEAGVKNSGDGGRRSGYAISFDKPAPPKPKDTKK